MRNKIRRAHNIIFGSNFADMGHWSKDMVMRLLLEAKDAAVRSVLYKAPVATETKAEHG